MQFLNGAPHIVAAIAVAAALAMASPGYPAQQIPPRGPVLAKPAISIEPTTSPPVVDGSLDDACWDVAVTVRPFTLTYSARFAPYRAEALLTYDESHFYAGIRCFDPDPAVCLELPWPPAQDPWSAELLIDAGGDQSFYKTAVTSDGQVVTTQPLADAKAFRMPVNAALKRHEGRWEAEFGVPFAAVDLPTPYPTGTWRINLGWRRPNKLHYSAWAVTYAWFYEPQHFGEVRFGGPDALLAEIIQVTDVGIGENLLPVRISNRSEAEVACDVLLTLEDDRARHVLYHESVTVPAETVTESTVRYTLLDGLRGIATLEVFAANEARPRFRQSLPVELPANRRASREIERLHALARETLWPPQYWQQVEMLGIETSVLRLVLWDQEISPDSWRGFSAQVVKTLATARKMVWWADHMDELHNLPFTVGSCHSLMKLLRDEAYTDPPSKTVCFSAARGEYESVQLFVIPLGRILENLTVDVSPLEGPRGHAIPTDAIEVRWNDFVETRPPRYPIDYTGWTADPLLPINAVERTVPAQALYQPIWLTVHVPRDIPAGMYTGTAHVRADKCPSWPVRLRLRVYDFDLPVRPALRTAFWLNEDHIKQWYGWEEIPQDIRRNHMAFLLEHRLNPATPEGPVGSEEDIEFQLNRGLNMVMLGRAERWPLREKDADQITRLYDFFKKRGLLDLAYIYALDEPSPSAYPQVRDTLKQVAGRFPGVRRVCTAFPPAKLLEGSVDTWVVGPNLFNYGPVAERQAAGNELWLYLSASVKRPYVNLYIDYTALENRLITWYCWKYGATGLLYWGINEWASNNRPWSPSPDVNKEIEAGRRWPDVPWNTWTYLDVNGEAQLIYPGRNGEFWSSVRMEILRDAIEDYDYLALLAAARKRLASSNVPRAKALIAHADELLTIGPPLASDLSEATKDPHLLLQRRNAIAEHLEQMLHALNVPEPPRPKKQPTLN